MEIKSRKEFLVNHPKFYHISFNDSLEGIWVPGEQAGSDEVGEAEDSSWAYPEPAMKAICVGTDIVGCFIGVFPNVAKFFEEKNYPHMNFTVYTPEFQGRERIVSNHTLTKDRLVWDAHITGEWRILDPVMMKKVGEIEVFNTNRSKTRKTHPFNDPSLSLESVGPEIVKFNWL